MRTLNTLSYTQNPDPNLFKHSLREVYEQTNTTMQYEHFREVCIYPRKGFIPQDQFIKLSRQGNLKNGYKNGDHYITDRARDEIMKRYYRPEMLADTDLEPVQKKSISQMKYWSATRGLYP